MNPYENLPDKAFWKKMVAERSMFDLSDLWSPKFKVSRQHRVVTFGSCFAQHIGRALKSRGYHWVSAETPPKSLSDESARKYNYNIFSARTGNIYTTSLLKQWVEWALEKKGVPEEIWEKDGRFYDPFRPAIEPQGFCSEEELRQSRNQTISSFRECIKTSDFFVFTLGLTERWLNSKHGYEYPMCPGTSAGMYQEDVHAFSNQIFHEGIKSMTKSMEMMRQVNPSLKFILTVSPVPLVATNSSNNVLVATMESKSILRAVAGQLARQRPYVDYFPSYEIINSPVFRGVFFEPNQRSVNPAGVQFVMNQFFQCQQKKFGSELSVTDRSQQSDDMERSELVCEEEILEAFGGEG
ncbi:GSCFA domain-containing protein [Halomonas sp. DP8Y7-1]|uniref:GSCFA domain-containing protein n=1 Tax=unclassified Halomonas TaxID=2609666 RepID=UPI001C949097|nr:MULTISPECIES: GSCFA domain-containing protein [unclassified Halomonas]MBY5930921.1 GSCFA domain-containing protein [Halomonas sp. DP8Y7-3]MBY6027740.1 GSCFA domain-containing protein [Halomonas sp. DP8Y7-1]